ncbi:GAF domain-containing protein [Jatrophihabitans sp. GAS493]|uniref:GAF and ANTAR domain-containing protein n=1 Tax=Jatrophihabitans sp. GAS493 TaxID=1907575 RepID=UPI000BB96230|nr:GAF and ANTAR domain-containing protein [Jatrophihabitans sp. GAS493]SOD73606.1 GAF domain-containing protein [Jatrophihabitans sp. GAS493]
MTTPSHPLEDLEDQTWTSLMQLARSLHLKDAKLQPTLDAIISQAVQTIEPAEHAGVILVLNGKLIPQATLGEPPYILDSLQQQTGSGPCIDSAREQSVISIDNMGTDTRWPKFIGQAISLGVSSMLCVPLWVDELRLGTLSLYGQKPDAFTPQHLQLAYLYATHAALALADAQRTAQLLEALRNRDVIGQAKGILIERLKITPQEAFVQLSSASQRANVKLTVVAEHLVTTGELMPT